MAGVCVIGLQWGDEAKGKLVDLLTGQFDIVVRYQGGANAGHTVVAGDKTYKLHQIPSGVLTPGVMNVVGPGVVLNPPVIIEEMDRLISQGVKFEGNLMLSDRAHVVLPWHIAEDQMLDKTATTDGESIGTTLRGIGPCYRDKVGRSYAVRLGDFYRDSFRQRIAGIVEAKKKMLAGISGESVSLDAAAICDEFHRYGERLAPHVGDTTAYLLDAVEAGKRLLFEGAQGALLDVDHGTYPYVTSSNSSGVGVSAGSGVPGRWIEKVIGVIKAYTTRVGGGPFPTELKDDVGSHIRERGREYGTTTGRPRRCGWFDAVAARYTARLSGVDSLSLMMMDVLSELPQINVCVAYEVDGVRTDRFPSHADDLRRAVPVYETLPGWQQDVTRVRRMEDFPANARSYIDRISQLIGRPVEVVSVGPDRQQTIFASGALSSVT
ncbi:MAG: adenylosuccinate synthase [Planctomycetes bacterium]|nr:adenylosuccinate synthase [Planctomycetota bacterium]